jgi:hypothetical protein
MLRHLPIPEKLQIQGFFFPINGFSVLKSAKLLYVQFRFTNDVGYQKRVVKGKHPAV